MKAIMTTPRNTCLLVADSIRNAVTGGEYTSRLPTQKELERTYGVGTGVIMRALKKLQKEGLVESVPGIGWFVAQAGVHHSIDVRLREMLMEQGFRPGSRFPSENQLCVQFDRLSRQAIRGAIARLTGEGLISDREGRYRYVLAIPTSKERP